MQEMYQNGDDSIFVTCIVIPAYVDGRTSLIMQEMYQNGDESIFVICVVISAYVDGRDQGDKSNNL